MIVYNNKINKHAIFKHKTKIFEMFTLKGYALCIKVHSNEQSRHLKHFKIDLKISRFPC